MARNYAFVAHAWSQASVAHAQNQALVAHVRNHALVAHAQNHALVAHAQLLLWLLLVFFKATAFARPDLTDSISTFISIKYETDPVLFLVNLCVLVYIRFFLVKLDLDFLFLPKVPR
jgi:hypothetical protein